MAKILFVFLFSTFHTLPKPPIPITYKGENILLKALSKNINSLENETTPYLTSDGKYLFFSSDGLPGYGGYDIYYCENIEGVWSAPKNLGLAINSANNDTHFQFNPKKIEKNLLLYLLFLFQLFYKYLNC